MSIATENQLIPVTENGNNEVVVSGRDLHKFLELKTEYKKWFSRMIQYGFEENEDFARVTQNCPTPGGVQQVTDHVMKIEMAKEISMIQRNERGKQARQYFLQIEKAWNSPEMIMKRALQIADRKIIQLEEQIKLDKPKTLFADAVASSKTSILVNDLAKLLKQNGVEIGGRRLFTFLRENGYLIKRKGTDYNMPTQYSMERGWFEVKETTVVHSDGHTSISKTPKVTGKGQQYFINKFLGEAM